MEIEGKIIQKLPAVSGTSKQGNAWNKQEYVLETKEAYPRKVFFDFFGERASQYNLEVGDDVRLSFDIESREYNGRWYTSIRGWKAEKLVGQPAGAGAPAPEPYSAAPAAGSNPFGTAPAAPAPFGDAINNGGANEDLPF